MKNLLSVNLFNSLYIIADATAYTNFRVFNLMYDHLLSHIKDSVMKDLRMVRELPRTAITDALRAEIYNEES